MAAVPKGLIPPYYVALGAYWGSQIFFSHSPGEFKFLSRSANNGAWSRSDLILI